MSFFLVCQQKISGQYQKSSAGQVRLNEYDDAGRAEVQFTDGEGVVHFIYVDPDFIRIV